MLGLSYSKWLPPVLFPLSYSTPHAILTAPVILDNYDSQEEVQNIKGRRDPENSED